MVSSMTLANSTFLRSGAVESYAPSWVMPSVAAVMVALTTYGSIVTPSKQPNTTAENNNQGETDNNNNNNNEKPDAETRAELNKRLPAALAGVMASAGLTLGTMVYPAVVRSFLDLNGISEGTWDPTLMFVMVGGLLTSFASYQFVPKHNVIASCPKLSRPVAGGDKFGVPTNQTIDTKLLLGAALFGTGWGISGLCPGPALLLTMTGLNGMVMQFWPSYYVGNRVAELFQEYL